MRCSGSKSDAPTRTPFVLKGNVSGVSLMLSMMSAVTTPAFAGTRVRLEVRGIEQLQHVLRAHEADDAFDWTFRLLGDLVEADNDFVRVHFRYLR